MARSRKTAEEGAPEGGDAPRRTGQRFVVSHLLAVHPEGQSRTDAVDLFSTRLERMRSNVNVLADATAGAASAGGERRVLLVEAETEEMARLAAELTRDTVVEPELPRVPAVARPPGLLAAWPGGEAFAGVAAAALAAAADAPPPPGTGAVLRLSVQDAAGNGVAGCGVIIRFNGVVNPMAAVVANATSDGDGTVSVPFDPNQWRPAMAALEPAGRFWTQTTFMPQAGQVIRLTELPAGPVGWWHLLSGATGYDPRAGEGIKVGVIDTGVGPHPALEHAVPVGAFLDGAFLPGPAEGLDAQTHGTHVSGIIGARPVNPGDFGGLAPGAELFVARVFAATGDANQGDIASAIDALSGPYGVDVINLSLTGAPSAIEHDAVIVALQRGTVCVCAAGNQAGPVGFPAGYPEAVAATALGLPNMAPADSSSPLNVPSQPDRFGTGGIFLASFSNTGPQVFATAGGNGIISTVPANAGDPAPYVDMSGTSMASPMTAATLAVLLGRDATYLGLPRGAARGAYARALLAQRAIPVLRSPLYEGYGLARQG